MNILFPLGAVLIWACNAIVNKLSASAIDPAAISFYRWLLALLVLTPFVLPGVIRSWRKILPYYAKLLVLGALGMVLYQSLAYYAAHNISALSMGIFSSLIPLLTILIAIPLLRLVPTLAIILGSLLSCAGIIWLISAGDPWQLVHQGIGQGELMMLLASSAYALYGVLTTRWLIPLPNWQALYVQILCGVLLLLPLFLYTENVALTVQNIPLVLFAGIPASIIAPFLWIQGIIRLGADKNAILMNLSPLFTALIAVLFLGESLQRYQVIGGGMILIGVILAQQLRTPLKQDIRVGER